MVSVIECKYCDLCYDFIPKLYFVICSVCFYFPVNKPSASKYVNCLIISDSMGKKIFPKIMCACISMTNNIILFYSNSYKTVLPDKLLTIFY